MPGVNWVMLNVRSLLIPVVELLTLLVACQCGALVSARTAHHASPPQYTAQLCTWRPGTRRCVPSYVFLLNKSWRHLETFNAKLTSREVALRVYCSTNKITACNHSVCTWDSEIKVCSISGAHIWLGRLCPGSQAYNQTLCSSVQPDTLQACQHMMKYGCIYDPKPAIAGGLGCTADFYLSWSHGQRTNFLDSLFHYDPQVVGCCQGTKLGHALLQCDASRQRRHATPDPDKCFSWGGPWYLTEEEEARIRLQGEDPGMLREALRHTSFCRQFQDEYSCESAGPAVHLDTAHIRRLVFEALENQPLSMIQCGGNLRID